MERGKLILAQNQYYSLDCYETQLNNNVLVVGTSGAGKTRSIVCPNLLQATGSYVVTDPKGNLYGKYAKYLEENGYEVKKLDFTNPKESAHYNFFNYIKDQQDIIKIAHALSNQDDMSSFRGDPFWDDATELLLQAMIAYMLEGEKEEDRHFQNMMNLLETCKPGTSTYEGNRLELKFNRVQAYNPQSFAARQFKKFSIGTEKTLKSILITLYAKLGKYDSPELNEMMKTDDIDLESIGKKKTALFVVVSDTDRSLDGLVNIFFTQAMNVLCSYADRECEDSMLPVPVRFIMDDFATNCAIVDFQKMIASIRSRGISVMLMIQAEAQLSAMYGPDAKTIIGNCDTYVYLGGNDVETAESIAKRCNVLPEKILYMPVGTNWIFRRGQRPINGKNFVLEDYERIFGEREDLILAK